MKTSEVVARVVKKAKDLHAEGADLGLNVDKGVFVSGFLTGAVDWLLVRSTPEVFAEFEQMFPKEEGDE